MRRTTLLVLSLAIGLVLAACSQTETTSNTNSSTTTSSTADKPPATTPASSTASTSGDKIGVPECDDFIAKYEACTSKVPEMAREQYKSAMVQWRASWKKLEENPQTKATLASACKQAAEQQAAAWKMYGCAN